MMAMRKTVKQAVEKLPRVSAGMVGSAARKTARKRNPSATQRERFKIHNKTQERQYFYKTLAEALKDAKSYASLDVVGDVLEDVSKRGASKWELRYWFDSTGVYPAGSYGQDHTRVNPTPRRKTNPVASRDTIKAAKLYQAFTGHEPETLGAIDFKLPKSMMVVGTCDAIEYTTVRAGKTERYRHVFRKSDRPQLLVSGDGKQTILAGGRYEFTERGFIDDSDTKNRY